MPAVGAAIGGAVALLTGPLMLPILLGVGAVAIGIGLSGFLQDQTAATATAGGVEYDAQAGEDVPVSTIFGRSVTAGMLVFHNEYGDDNEYIQLVYQLGYGYYDALEKVYVDQEEKALSGSNSDAKGRVVDDYTVSSTPHMWVKFYDGSQSTADAELISQSGGRWTSDHVGRFCPYIIVTMRYDDDLYGGSMPKHLFQVRGSKLYDPRKDDTQNGGSGAHRWGTLSTYEWSENPAVCSYNYKRGIWYNSVLVLGEGRDSYGVNLPYYFAAMNICDESIEYPETSHTLPRYHIGVEISDASDDQTVTALFESAMAGYGVEVGGAYRPLPGHQQSPVMTLTDDYILIDTEVTAMTRLPPSQTYTAVGGNFTDPAQMWQAAAYGTREDSAVDTAESGQRLLTMDLPFIHNIETAQMLAEVQRRRDRFQKSETLVVHPKYSLLDPGDVITRTKTLFGTIPMLVTSVEERDDKTVALELRHLDPSIFPASGDTFVQLPPDVGTAPAGPSRIIQLQGLALTPVQQVAGSTLKAAIKATWTAVTDPTVDRIVFKYWPTAGSEADDSTFLTVEVTSATAVVLAPLLPLTNYTVIAIIYTTPSRATFWTSPLTATTPDEQISATVPDGSINYAKLAYDLQNIYGVVFGSAPGSLAEKLAALEERIAQQELAALTDQMNNRTDTKLLKVVSGNSAAAVITEARVRADADGALASQITEVLAQLGNVEAGALFAIQSLVEGGGASATISMVVRAAVADNFSEAALRLIATADGLGGSVSEVQIMADRFVFISVDGDELTHPFTIEGGVVKLAVTRAGIITDSTAVEMWVDFDTKDIYMKG